MAPTFPGFLAARALLSEGTVTVDPDYYKQRQ